MAIPICELNRALIVRVVYYERFDSFTVCRVTEEYYDDAVVTVRVVRAFRDNIHFYE